MAVLGSDARGVTGVAMSNRARPAGARAGGEGCANRVQGGPLAKPEVAKALCAALTARGVDCLVVKP